MLVYMLLNINNGKAYIGSTTRPLNKRITEHFRNSSIKKNFKQDLMEYGRDSFFVSVLSRHKNFSDMVAAEKNHIADFCTTENGYNILVSSQGMRKAGWQEKISKSRLGQNHLEETKNKISESKRGKKIWRNGRKKEEMIGAIAASVAKRSMPIICENTGIVYNSSSDASRKLGIPRSSIHKVVTGQRNSCFGLKFRRISH